MSQSRKDDELPPKLSVTRQPGIRFPNATGPVEGIDAWSQSFSDIEGEGDYWHRVDIERIPFPIWIRLGMSIEDGFVVTGMLMGDPDGETAIGTGALNRIAINDILDSVSQIDKVDDLPRNAAHDFVGEVRRPGGQTQDMQAFQEAAEVYVLAQWGYSKALIGVVAQALGVSRATASRRVQKARDMGLVKMARDRLEALPAEKQEARGKKYGIVVLPEVLRHESRDTEMRAKGDDDA